MRSATRGTAALAAVIALGACSSAPTDQDDPDAALAFIQSDIAELTSQLVSQLTAEGTGQRTIIAADQPSLSSVTASVLDLHTLSSHQPDGMWLYVAAAVGPIGQERCALISMTDQFIHTADLTDVGDACTALASRQHHQATS